MGRLADKMEKERGRRWVGPAAVFALLGGFALLMWVRSLPPTWIELKDPKGLFSVQFPDQPKKLEKDVPTWTGSTATVRSFVYGSEWEDEFYAIEAGAYDRDLPAEKTEILFDGMTDAYLKGLQAIPRGLDAMVVSSKRWAFAGQPGREVEIDIGHGSFLLAYRYLLIEHRQVVILRTGVHEHHHGENDARFFESFKLLGR